MFVAAFHIGLRAGHFNESLAQKPAETMDHKERAPESGGSRYPDYHRRRWPNKDHRTSRNGGSSYYPQKRGAKPFEQYAPLNRARVHILDEILQAGLSKRPPPPERHYTMGRNENEFCHYHRCKGHDTEKCFRLKDLIEELIRSGHLKKFIERAAQENKARQRSPRSPRSPRNPPTEDAREKDQPRISVNTIAGGFAGGGNSNNARKRYVRKSERELDMVGHVSFPPAPDLSFSPKDATNVAPHDDDPLVIQVQILNCDVKRVLIDSGSSADIMYWDAFKAMQLAGKQLQPYHGTLYPLDNGGVGTIRGDQVLARQCYESSLKIKKREISRLSVNTTNTHEMTELDPREDFQERRVSPIEELEEIQIGKEQHQTTSIGTAMGEKERRDVLAILRENVDLFAWKPEDMPGIDETRKRKQREERRTAVDEEVEN
ncbi:hypothetical protein P8452_42457 [Trifolium repens]|nr:hypothetical protein P8452_42457 [Trifolium repens]